MQAAVFAREGFAATSGHAGDRIVRGAFPYLRDPQGRICQRLPAAAADDLPSSQQGFAATCDLIECRGNCTGNLQANDAGKRSSRRLRGDLKDAAMSTVAYLAPAFSTAIGASGSAKQISSFTALRIC